MAGSKRLSSCMSENLQNLSYEVSSARSSVGGEEFRSIISSFSMVLLSSSFCCYGHEIQV